MADRRRTQGCLLPIGLVLVVVLGTLAALRVLPDGPPPEQFVIGDSVTYMAAGSIQQRFDPNHLQFIAKPGFPTPLLVPLVKEAMATSGEPAHARERVAVLVGYNDVRVRGLDTPALPELAKLASEFECGVFLTVPARPSGVSVDNAIVKSELVDQWNLRLRAEVAKYPNLHVSDEWERAVDDAGKGELLKADEVHPNRVGQARLAEIYRNAIDENC